jgi:hypothetical protein
MSGTDLAPTFNSFWNELLIRRSRLNGTTSAGSNEAWRADSKRTKSHCKSDGSAEGPYRFFSFSSDRGEPIHVHVERERKTAKFWLGPCDWSTTTESRQPS